MTRRRTLCRTLMLVLIAAVCVIGAVAKLIAAPHNLDLTFRQKHPENQRINRKRESLLDCLKGSLIQICSWIDLVGVADKKTPSLAFFLTLGETEVFTMGYSQKYRMGRMESW